MEATMKTLIITGASKGIGFAIAQKFCNEGHRVINFSRSPAPDERIENHGIDLTLEDADTTVKELLDLTLDPGEIILINNAAILVNDSVLDVELKEFREVLNLNVFAAQLMNQAVINKMRPGSAIIYLGSTLAEKAVANTFSYVTSKHAVIGMMRATCQDLAGTGIHTACVCPGFTDTEMLQVHLDGDEDVLAEIAKLSTFGRLITPEEIADTLFFAAFNPVVNGSVIHANLGQVES
jgi:3-oxoacyl-[acyl-carrier protein] reductase